jgi:hypothetical protein
LVKITGKLPDIVGSFFIVGTELAAPNGADEGFCVLRVAFS